MKRSLSVMFVVLVIMAIFTSTALAAPAQTGKSVTLVSIDYQRGGIVLLFHTSGLTQDDLRGATFYANSNSQDIYCNFIDSTTDVRCVVSKKLAGAHGGFHVILAGSGFNGELPNNPSCPDGQTAYVNYSVSDHGQLVYTEGIVPLTIWNGAIVGGFFEEAAQNGINFEITGQFCSPDYYGPV